MQNLSLSDCKGTRTNNRFSPYICQNFDSLLFKYSTFPQPELIHKGQMASLTLSWFHFNVIKWNQKALLKELKTGSNTHFRQRKNVKIGFFLGLHPWNPKVGKEACSTTSSQTLLTWKAHKIQLLVFNFHVQYKENSQLKHFLFQPWYTNQN